ncbi:hypothetical protein CKA32_002334 [Geitlerinema sp. FC II]|nr:hypothetical protein CKA32_002334 [Geitlerinema sp. FC II]
MMLASALALPLLRFPLALAYRRFLEWLRFENFRVRNSQFIWSFAPFVSI